MREYVRFQPDSPSNSHVDRASGLAASRAKELDKCEAR